MRVYLGLLVYLAPESNALKFSRMYFQMRLWILNHSAVAIRRWRIDVACFDHSITFDRRSNQNCQQFLASSQQLSGKQAIFHDFLPFEKMQNGHWNHALSSSSGPPERTYRAEVDVIQIQNYGFLVLDFLGSHSSEAKFLRAF